MPPRDFLKKKKTLTWWLHFYKKEIYIFLLSMCNVCLPLQGRRLTDVIEYVTSGVSHWSEARRTKLTFAAFENKKEPIRIQFHCCEVNHPYHVKHRKGGQPNWGLLATNHKSAIFFTRHLRFVSVSGSPIFPIMAGILYIIPYLFLYELPAWHGQ